MLAVILALSVSGCAKASDNYCMKADKITVTEEMYSYMFNSFYRSFAEEHADYVKSSGLDTSAPLRSQLRSDGSSWYDYLSSLLKARLEEMLALANGAKSEGTELSEEGEKNVERALEKHERDAKASFMTAEEYLSANFGEGVTRKTAEECLRLKELSEQYGKYLKENTSVSEKECESYFEENPSSMLRYDYIKITVPKENVERLMSAYDRETFTYAVRDTITELNFHGNYGKFSEEIDRLTEEKTVYGESYIPGSELSIWAFDEGRRAFDIHTKEQSTGQITVTMILSAKDKENPYNEVLYRDDEPLRNAKYILFEDKTEAQGIYDKYKGVMSRDVFEELSERYGSESLENVDRQSCIKAMQSWIFDHERKVGDVGLAISPGGEAYIVLYEEPGEAAWLHEAKGLAATDGYKEKLAALKSEYPCKVNEEKIAQVQELPFKN